jgi:hypothetical protein
MSKDDAFQYNRIMHYLAIWGWKAYDDRDASRDEWSYTNDDGLVIRSSSLDIIFAFADGHFKGKTNCKNLISNH